MDSYQESLEKENETLREKNLLLQAELSVRMLEGRVEFLSELVHKQNTQLVEVQGKLEALKEHVFMQNTRSMMNHVQADPLRVPNNGLDTYGLGSMPGDESKRAAIYSPSAEQERLAKFTSVAGSMHMEDSLAQMNSMMDKDAEIFGIQEFDEDDREALQVLEKKTETKAA